MISGGCENVRYDVKLVLMFNLFTVWQSPDCYGTLVSNMEGRLGREVERSGKGKSHINCDMLRDE
jgi:hypothetical protein